MALYTFKILKSNGISYLRIRSIMTSINSLKKFEEELAKNPYFGKYHEKIEKLRKEKPAEYNERIKNKVQQEKVKEDKKKSVKYPDPKAGPSVGLKKSKNCLNNIFKLDMVENKTTDEIKTIWNEYHKGKEVVYSTFTSDQYTKLNENLVKYPTFVFPLPRGDGYEFFLFQYSDNELHYTPLVQYKKHGENSPECLLVTYFTELKDKDIVLMKGEYDKDVLSSLDSQYLLNLTHMFYSSETRKLSKMIETFNNKPVEFKFPEVISEVERMGFKILE